MAIIVNYFENFNKWNLRRALHFLWSEEQRFLEDVRFEPGGREERLIARNDKEGSSKGPVHAEACYYYARDVLKGRFELGEQVIADSSYFSYQYARDVMKGRFVLGEPAIAKGAFLSYLYARDVIKCRFELGEPAIARDADYRPAYIRDVIFGRVESLLGDKELINLMVYAL